MLTNTITIFRCSLTFPTVTVFELNRMLVITVIATIVLIYYQNTHTKEVEILITLFVVYDAPH